MASQSPAVANETGAQQSRRVLRFCLLTTRRFQVILSLEAASFVILLIFGQPR